MAQRSVGDHSVSRSAAIAPFPRSMTRKAFLVVEHSRRELLWPGVTAHPTAEWIAHQLTEACGLIEPIPSGFGETDPGIANFSR
jgi:hypothetical protein